MMQKLIRAFLALVLALSISSPVFAARTLVSTATPAPILAGPPGATTLDIVWTAADTVNNNAFTMSGNDVLLCYNSGASPYTVTVSSVADSLGRTGDIATYSIAAGTISWIGPIPVNGFAQANGQCYISASNVAVKFAVIKVAGSVSYK